MKNIVLWKPVESPSEVQIQRPRVGRGGAPGLGHPGAGNGRRGWPSGPETGVLARDSGVRDRDVEGVPCVRTSVGPRGDGNQKIRKPTPRPPVKAAGLSVFLSFSYGPYRVSVVALLMASDALSAAACNDFVDRCA